MTVFVVSEWYVIKKMSFCSEWSSLEKEMGDGLQKSGHYMDRWAGYLIPSSPKATLYSKWRITAILVTSWNKTFCFWSVTLFLYICDLDWLHLLMRHLVKMKWPFPSHSRSICTFQKCWSEFAMFCWLYMYSWNLIVSNACIRMVCHWKDPTSRRPRLISSAYV